MAHVERYYTYIYWNYNDSQNRYKISILKEGFSGSATELIKAANPLLLRSRASIKEKDNIIFGSEVQLSFMANPSPDSWGYLLGEDGDRIEIESESGYVELEDDASIAGTIIDYDDLLDSVYKDYKLKIFRGTKIYAGLFDGINDYVNLTYDAGNVIDPTVTNWQFEASIWIDEAAVGDFNIITIAGIGYNYVNTQESYGLEFVLNTDTNRIAAGIGAVGAGAAGGGYFDAYSFERETWYDIKVTRTGGNLLSLYVNGALHDTFAETKTADNGGYDSTIGVELRPGGNIKFWEGQIRDVKYKELNAPDVEFLDMTLNNTLNNTVVGFPDGVGQGGFTYIQVSPAEHTFTNVVWEGYVNPENSDRNLFDYKFKYLISANDALADLKEIDYTQEGTDTILNVIKNALNESGIELPFSIQLGTYEASEQSSTDCALNETTLIEDRFISQESEAVERNKCHEAIEKALLPFNCVIRQSEGRYWIINYQEPKGHKFTYTWALGSETRVLSDLRVNIHSFKYTQGRVQKIKPIKFLNIRILNRSYATEQITNGNFDSDVSGWTGAGWENSTPDHATASPQGGVMNLEQTDDNPNSFYNTATFAIEFGPDAALLTVYWIVACYSYDGGDPPQMKVDIDNTEGEGPIVGEYQVMYTQDGGFYNMSQVFDVSSLTSDGDVTLTFDMVVDGGTTDAKFYVDDIWIQQQTETSVADWMHKFKNSNGVETKEIDVFFADKQEDVSEICRLSDSGVLTDLWNRYGKTDGLQLIEILGQQIMNNYGSYKDYTPITVKDPDELIRFHSVIKMNTKLYQILGGIKDFKEGEWTLKMAEILHDQDLSITKRGYKLLTIDGEE